MGILDTLLQPAPAAPAPTLDSIIANAQAPRGSGLDQVMQSGDIGPYATAYQSTFLPFAVRNDGSVKFDPTAGLPPTLAGLAAGVATAPYEALKDVTSGNLQRDAYAAYGGGAPSGTQMEGSRQDAQADVAGRSAAAAGSIMSPSTLEAKPAGSLGAFGGAAAHAAEPSFDDMMAGLLGKAKAPPLEIHPSWTPEAAAHLQYDHDAFASSKTPYGPEMAAMTKDLLEGGHPKLNELLKSPGEDGPYLTDLAAMYKPASGPSVMQDFDHDGMANVLASLGAKPVETDIDHAGMDMALGSLKGKIPKAGPDPLADLMSKIGEMPAAAPIDFSQHMKPIDWSAYYPPHDAGAVEFPVAATHDQAEALGYNTSVPLFKGMNWHAAPGEGLGETGGFADPAAKPNERAIFAADQAPVAQSYAHSYNLAPMYARADKAFEVNWPDVAGNPSYNGTVMERLIDHARAQGADALAIHNIHDLGGMQTQYAFMDPTKLRVRHAAFSPDAMGSADLLSARGVPLLSALLQQQGQQ